MIAKLYLYGAVLAALLLSGWGLYHQIQANGALKAQLIAEQAAAALNAEKAKTAIKSLKSEMEVRDAISNRLQAARSVADTKSARQSAALGTVYREPAVAPWADTVPPERVRAAAAAALDCLWQPAPKAGAGAGGCADSAAGGAATGLPAPGG